MAVKKVTIERKIKMFIARETPTWGELVKFIVVKCSKLCKTKDFKLVNYRGHYSTNAVAWKYNGNVEVINGRYHLTDYALMNWEVSLYQEPLKKKVKRLNQQLSHLENRYDNERRENRHYYIAIRDLYNETINKQS